jgi:hypothetical protein
MIDLHAATSLLAPILHWIEDHPDNQLAVWVGQRITPDTWSHLVCAGMLVRLLEYPDPKQAVERLLQGLPDPLTVRPYGWAVNWTKSQEDEVQELFLAEIDMIVKGLEELDPNDPVYEQDLIELCVRRDELEGVGLLLFAIGKAERVSSYKLMLDAHASEQLGWSRENLPQVENKRLYRAYQTMNYDEDLWWLWPVVPTS